MSPSSTSWSNIALVTSSSLSNTLAGPLRCIKSGETAPFLTTDPLGAIFPFNIAIPPSLCIGLSNGWITSVFVTSTSFMFSPNVFVVTVTADVSILSPSVFNTPGIPPALCKSIIVSVPAGEIRQIWGTTLLILSNKSRVTSTPSISLAIAGIWSAVLLDPPRAMSIVIALLNASCVKISEGFKSASTNFIICFPEL